MVGAHDRSVDQSKVVARWLLGALLVLIAMCAIAGVIVAISMGHTTVALMIALVSGAFFFGLLA